ncbi:MAG: TonB-dependent receptor [Ignavibacteriaceae bacterium]|nr:TonB-dependent receptor [Ignavibacteriaceae bacterium]
MRRIFSVLSILILIIPFLNSAIMAANTGIEGHVKDAKTGESLFGANIILVGTSMGGATDMDGNYTIPSAIPGTYTIRVTYVGYKEQQIEIKVSTGARVKKDFALEPVGIEGQVVVVTAQASGQKQAINQQLTSDQIINVVSAAKIQELPDANAAESVGRLPGISITRSGGEGTEVVIRGMAPKYNEVMIDGIKMSSTDAGNRSTDLSMVSSNMLDGIQVSKTVTPDMDADVLGGTVNFELREAKVKEPGVPQFSLQVQGGYNNLSDAYNKFNNYKYIGSVEDRFLDDKLGVFAQIDIERKNLPSNEMGASYTHNGNDLVQYLTSGVTLDNISRDKQRYNGAFVLDYKLPEGKIKLTNFFSSGTTDAAVREETFDITGNNHYYRLTGQSSKLNIITNGISLQQQLPIFELNAKLSHSYSETNTPNTWMVEFVQGSAGLSKFSNLTNVDPQAVPKASNNNLAATSLNAVTSSSSFSRERALTGSVDLKTNLTLTDLISAEIKFGGKYRYQTKSYAAEEYDNGAGSLTYGGGNVVDDLIETNFGLSKDNPTSIAITNFADPGYSYGKFLNGDYSMVSPLSYGKLAQLVNLLKNNINYIANKGGQGGFAKDNFLSTTNNFDGHENMSAFYLMSIVNVGQQITLIPGVRYQNLQTTYTGVRGKASPESYDIYNHYDTTTTQTHGYWLPDVSLRYKPLSWLDVRLSYTNTLSYPDYSAIIPRIEVSNSSSGIDYNNFQLKPSRSTNYDAYVSVYDNTIGLFTVGGFLKQITDLIYSWTFYVKGTDALKYYPTQLGGTVSSTTIYPINTYLNNSYKINDYGMEIDWQTHFWYLPGPLSGLVFNANYTHIFSKAQYPIETFTAGRKFTTVDTSFTDRLVYQPDDIVNLSLGFDYKDFSIRVSMLYQADIFTGPSAWPQLKSHTSAYRRWDVAAKQELPWFGIEVYGDLNNINGADDVSVIQGGGVPTSEQDYGMTADFGIKVNL